ncbi:S-layer homology domain-containing protein [Alteribacillus iranensis]|nr:S-layer homology domain-containing protein [Alteribacillus iranensis]
MLKKAKLWLVTGAVFMGLTPVVEAERSFQDIPESYWAYEEMEEMAEKGIVNGYPDGTYRPQTPVTRSQSAVIIGRALEIDVGGRPDPGFEDVSKEMSSSPYIAALVEEGVFDQASHFRPGESLTRAQMAKVLTEAFDLKGTSSHSFRDVDEDHWAYSYVNTLLSNDITTGTSPTTFSPNDPVTRTHLAVFIYRVLDEESDEPPQEDPPDEEDTEEPGNNQPSVIENIDDIREAYSSEMTTMEAEVLRLVNDIRREHGLQPLKAEPDAVRLSRFKSEEMRDQNYFDHVSPDYGMDIGYDETFDAPIQIHGSNIAAGQPTPEAVVDAWMNSPGHRENILRDYYDGIGIGLAEGGSYGYYWTQLFTVD